MNYKSSTPSPSLHPPFEFSIKSKIRKNENYISNKYSLAEKEENASEFKKFILEKLDIADFSSSDNKRHLIIKLQPSMKRKWRVKIWTNKDANSEDVAFNTKALKMKILECNAVLREDLIADLHWMNSLQNHGIRGIDEAKKLFKELHNKIQNKDKWQFESECKEATVFFKDMENMLKEKYPINRIEEKYEEEIVDRANDYQDIRDKKIGSRETII